MLSLKVVPALCLFLFRKLAPFSYPEYTQQENLVRKPVYPLKTGFLYVNTCPKQQLCIGLLYMYSVLKRR